MIKSDTVNGVPIGWGALSGITPEPTAPGRFYVVPDSFYQPSRILTLDMGLAAHARITGELAQADADERTIGRLMAGAAREAA